MPPQDFLELLAVARSYQRSRALTVAAELGVADLLVPGPRDVGELAAATGSSPDALYRLLRALASIGVFTEGPERTFALNARAEYLRDDHPLSVRPVVRMFGADYQWRAWGELPYSVRTGRNAAEHALGTDVWEHRRQHPVDGEVFDAAMRTFAASDAAALVAAYDFGRHAVVADVGGGTGTTLAAVLRSAPRTRGLLFDQPQVVAGAADVLRAAGVADRVEVRGGSFFDVVPGGADAYLLRRILHDWDDERAGAILGRVRAAMGPDARLLVVDAVVGPPDEEPLAAFLDLMMLVSEGGRERTREEWSRLLAGSGFRLEQVTPVTANSAVLEAAPR